MIFLDTLKLIAEVITSLATAGVVIISLFKFMFKLSEPMKMFFKGYTDVNGKKIRFCKGLKMKHEQTKRIINAIAPNLEMEDVLVLDKKALLDIISKSEAFRTISMRKQ